MLEAYLKKSSKNNIIFFILSIVFGLTAGYVFFLSQGLLGNKLKLVVPVVLIAAPAIVLYLQYGFDITKPLLMLSIVSVPTFIDFDFLFRGDVSFWVSANGFPITLSDVFFYPLVTLWFLSYVLTPPAERKRIEFGGIIGTYLTLFLLVNISSLFFVEHPFFSMSVIFMQIKCYVFYFYLINHITDEESILLVIRSLMLVLFMEAIIGIEQKFIGTIFTADFLGVGNVTSNIVQMGDKLITRVSGTLGHPNNLAMFLNLMLPIAIFSLFEEKSKKWRLFTLMTVCLALLTEIMTASRGGWLGLILSLFVAGIILTKRKGHNPFYFVVIGSLVAAFALITLFMVSSTIQTRLTEDDDGSAEVRYPLMQVARNMIFENPVFGTGLNNYTANMVEYDDTYLSIASIYNYPVHNTFLLVGGETGLLGLGVLSILMVLLLYMGYQAVFRLTGMAMMYVLGACAGLLTWIIHNQVNLTLIWNDYILWVIVSAVATGSIMAKDRDQV